MSSDHLDNESFSDFEKSCPLCMELFDLDDMGFLPCPCGYRICRFCWHRLKTYEDNIEAGFEDQDGSASSGRCPACRQVYSDVPAGFDSNLTAMLDSNKYKKKKKRLQNKQKQKLQEEKQKLKEILKRDEKSLAGLRVVQKNLVFVIGIQQRSHEELRREFSKFGKTHKVVFGGNTNNTNLNTAYVTYTRPEDAIKAIQALNQGCLNSQLILNSQSKLGKTGANNRPAQGILKASLGTTKYCNHWLKNLQCPKLPDCMYLHELADQEASFTKEDMQKNKHAEYEKKLIQEYLDKNKANNCELLTDNNLNSNNSNSLNSNSLNSNSLNSNSLNSNNLKNSHSENSNSSSSIDNLGLSNNTTENHPMNGDEDSRQPAAAYDPFEFTTEDSSVFGTGRKFGAIASGHSGFSSAGSFSLSRLPEGSDPPNEQQRLSKENCDKENASSSAASSSQQPQQNGGSRMTLGPLQTNGASGGQSSEETNGDAAHGSQAASSNNICINSSSYIDAQQLLTIDDSQNSITASNHLNGNSSANGLLLSSSNAKSKCIQIDNSRSSKMRINLIDEIIANSSDSSTTSYSTCSSGSNRLAQTDLNEFSNLILNGEHLNSLNLESDAGIKFGQHSPNNHHHHNSQLVGSLEDDGLDFDPISVSTIGLQDLLKTSSSTAGHANSANLLNQNSTASTLNQLLFGHSLVQQAPTSPPHSQPFGQLGGHPLGHPLGHLTGQPASNPLGALNGVLHNSSAQQPTKPSLSQLSANSDRQSGNPFGSLFASSASNPIAASLGSLGSLNSNSLQQPASTNGASTPMDPNDTWRNSLRALLPNVNITFSNSSSSSANQQQQNSLTANNLTANSLTANNLTANNLTANNLTANSLNPASLAQQNNLTASNLSQTSPQMLFKQQLNPPQQQNAIKNNQQQQQQQSFLNQLQQNHHQQMQQQQPPNIYPLAFLHQQLLRQQQQAAAGLNLQFANANPFFGEPQQMKNQMQASPSQPQPIAPQHLNNLQRFFQQPPPGF